MLLRALGGEARLIEAGSAVLSALVEGVADVAVRQMSKEEMILYLYASIVHLLFEFKRDGEECAENNTDVSELVRDALSIVDEEYAMPLRVDTIACSLHVSGSLLSHAFKREMGISVYQYISKKRLSVVKELIASGIPITLAATQIGFSDYSCFLRMYKAQYGCAPSKKNARW